MFSVLFRLKVEGHKLPLLQYAITLAIVQAIDQITQCEAGDFARIKWPNDIYINSTKVGGVLCQTVYKGQGEFQLIAGVGLNIDNAKPTFCINDSLR